MSTKHTIDKIGNIASKCALCPFYLKNSSGTNSKRPSFSFQYLQKGFDLSKCTKNEKLAFLNTLLKQSQLSWSDLELAPRHGIGKENIDKKAIKAPIPPVVKEDTKLWAFRFYGKAPFVGFREGETFYILWIDRGFKLYTHA